MKSLYALASHAAGDFPLQTDRMAAEKFDNRRVRAGHVAAYTAAFIPAILTTEWDGRQIAVFLGTIAATHFVIDSRRWNEAVPIWYDQSLHVIALAVATALAEALGIK